MILRIANFSCAQLGGFSGWSWFFSFICCQMHARGGLPLLILTHLCYISRALAESTGRMWFWSTKSLILQQASPGILHGSQKSKDAEWKQRRTPSFPLHTIKEKQFRPTQIKGKRTRFYLEMRETAKSDCKG